MLKQVGVGIIGLTSLIFSSPLHSAIEQKVKPTSHYSLSSALQKNILGLHLGLVENPEALQKDAKIYAAIRHHSLPPREEKKFIQACKNHESSSLFCDLLQEDEPKPLKNKTQSSRFKNPIYSSRRRQEVSRLIRQGDVEKLSEMSEEEIRASLKKISTPLEISKLSQEIEKLPACKNIALSFLVGNKTEEFLPDTTLRSQAIRLYEKAANCGDHELSTRSKFRLSLLQIWNDNCKEAIPHLKALTSQQLFTEYQSRAFFWQYRCGVQLKNKPLQVQAQQSLKEKYPFSLHTLLLAPKDLTGIDPIDSPFQEDTLIHYRTMTNSDMNRKISLVEALLEVKEDALAQEILETFRVETSNLHPQLRLYIATLHHRVKQYLTKFRILNSVFRDAPELISKSTLELYYSQNTLLLSQLSLVEADAMLILSLIRQESAFNSKARSRAGALGLMQVMPRTARKIARILRPSELLNPVTNIRVGSKYLAFLRKNYKGDAELALAAYNAGPSRVDQWLKRYPVKDRALFLDLIPFKETREYVASIARSYFWYSTFHPFFPTQLTDSHLSEKKEPRRNIAEVFSVFGT